MKFFFIFIIFVFGEREVRADDFYDCGFLTEFNEDLKTVEISSPVDPLSAVSNSSLGTYPRNAYCEWIFLDQCADGFHIQTLRFDINGARYCQDDKLHISNAHRSFNSTFCNQDFEYDYDGKITLASLLNETVGGNLEALDAPIFVPGDQLKIVFESDHWGEMNEGFHLLVTPERKDVDCKHAEIEPVCVWPYKEDDESVIMEAWNIGSQDKFTPYSIFSDIFEKEDGVDDLHFRRGCAERCRDTPGCFKFKFNGPNTCQLRGHKIDNRDYESFALTGKDCSEPPQLLWRDFKTESIVYCLFYHAGDANKFKNKLIKNNGVFLKWNVSDAGKRRRMSKKWTFEVATDRESSKGTWYKFESVVYYRTYLVGIESSASERQKKQGMDEAEQLFFLTTQVIQNFIDNLWIGSKTEVLKTEVPKLTVDELSHFPDKLDLVENSPSEEMINSFSKLEDIFKTKPEKEKNKKKAKKMEQFKKIIDKFSWMFENSSSPCENSALSVFGTKEWKSPKISTENICESFVALMDSTVAFYDNHVCLDQINFDRKSKRRNKNIKSDVKRSKKIFNRFLETLECTERLSIN
ncbi:Oidioi.mRNA.OKI2018_I69.chr2.g4728.t1.cds [Oikopleura dioica]|uniref:Oidioi.mRNA.OKI2018_I69.chr2.g4728.t1.cds n=1 Tax=Oikopleura dioica TaxID=34765 RepID=A0ABN7SY85_OIKDI|nr:Oidioi.mRNA.OKI2018_I69.chr2.g4728.t1.cds [Oikopleura dioica]